MKTNPIPEEISALVEQAEARADQANTRTDEANTRTDQANTRMEEANIRAEMTETVRDSELRYRRLFEAAKDGILILDEETGMIVDVNPFLIELLGLSHEAFLGKRVWELGPFKNIVANQIKFAELQTRKYVRYDDLPLEAADGRQIAVEFVSNVYLEKQKRVIQCNIRDGMKSCSNRRWANRKAWSNVPAEPVSACNAHGWPKVQRFDDYAELTAPICD